MFITLDNSHRFYELFERGVQRGLLYHVFFWVIFFLFLVVNGGQGESLGTEVLHKSIRILFYVTIVYTNLYVLFPRYLKTNQLFTYLALLILLVVVATPVEVLIHYVIFNVEGKAFEDVFTFENNSSFFLGSFFVGFSSSIYKIINDWMEHQRVRVELQKQNLTSELKYLKTQINPHFFFNTLNSLYALTLKKSDKAPEIVLKLSEMMRYMLYESNEKMISLSQEINYLNNYLELEKLRHGDKFDINLKIDGSPDGLQIAPLLFIPFLENSFKHGIDHQLNSGYVRINLDIKEKVIYLKVVNSMPSNAELTEGQQKVGGIGLTNVRRRLNILYPKKHKLTIHKTEDEFVVQLQLKIDKQQSKTTQNIPSS